MKEKVWLKPGDEVSVEVEKLGRLTNMMSRG
jgi:2-keto-4-pentenoate hydratase/2-oxohepta-3-ene-1,7-dioic acid hydratase in catechol pathway